MEILETITQLQNEISLLQTELDNIRQVWETQREQCVNCHIIIQFSPQTTPEALAQFHQQNQRLATQWYQEIETGIQNLKEIEKKFKQKYAQLNSKMTLLGKLKAQYEWQNLEKQIQTGKEELILQSRKINQISSVLKKELKQLKLMAENLNLPYTTWLQKDQEIVNFVNKTIPYIVTSENQLEVRGQEFDAQE